MQVGELTLEQNMVVVGARNIPGAPSTRATLVDGELHRLGDLGMLAHAEIVVGTPDGDVLLFACGIIADRLGKLAPLALQIGEYAVTAFIVQAVQFAFEETFEIHHRLQNLAVFLCESSRASTLEWATAAACGKRPLILNSSKLFIGD